jgi:type II secretory ATPase GspE/PulE/Tfp pilus assembly ATPase PilB-like protein
MDIHTLSLVELKQLAKVHNPPIKYYYIKSRVELIQILTMTEFTQDMITEKYTIHQLRKKAREQGHLNVWKMKRAELMDLLYPSAKQNNKNENDTKEHNNPKEREGKEVGV